MARYYSNPKRESDTYALPDVEVFGPVDVITCPMCSRQFQYEPAGGLTVPEACDCGEDLTDEKTERGYFWWSCFPGCMPDSDPIGPFKTHAEALADARDGADEYDEAEDEDLPLCVQSMRCYCAGHARGNPVDSPCDTSEEV